LTAARCRAWWCRFPRGRPESRTASHPSKEGNDRSRVAPGPRSTADRLRGRVVSCICRMGSGETSLATPPLASW
jgi:hypothetical protein